MVVQETLGGSLSCSDSTTSVQTSTTLQRNEMKQRNGMANGGTDLDHQNENSHEQMEEEEYLSRHSDSYIEGQEDC